MAEAITTAARALVGKIPQGVRRHHQHGNGQRADDAG
jgi:hypothetical protein